MSAASLPDPVVPSDPASPSDRANSSARPSTSDLARRSADDPQLAALGDAIADGEWPVSPGSSPEEAGSDGAAHPLLPELEAIARLAHAHRASSTLSDDRAASLDSSESLGEAMSRSAFAPLTTRPDLTGARRWGPLFVLDRIGGGSFGQVYRAWDPALEREVALKLLRLPSESRSTAHAVVREGQLLASVHHPNVISVYGAAAIDGEVGIWMELVRGRTLEQIVLEEGPMSAQEATVIADALCGALAAIHQRGLLHRDIKAANVMREAGGRIVLLDFGTGVEASTGTEGPRRLAGTPLYMAPEVLLDEAPASVQSDIYSLGVLLFFLVTGSFPVYGKTLTAVRDAHRKRASVLLSDVRLGLPREFVRSVESALSYETTQRPRTVGVFQAGLNVPLGAMTTASTTRSPWLLLTILLTPTAGVWGIGLLSSLAFNVTTGRVNGLAIDSVGSYWVLGLRALLLPLLFAAVTVLACLVLRLGARGLPRHWVEPARGRLVSLMAAPTFVEAVFLVEIAVIGMLCWVFGDFLHAVTSRLVDADPQTFDVLRPDRPNARRMYVFVLSMCALGFGTVWIVAAQELRQRNRPLDRWAGVALTVSLLLLLLMPYRLVWQNKRERMLWRGATCYAIDELPTEVLLYCPDTGTPRVRTVSAADPTLVRSGQFESLFTRSSEGNSR